jgi:hypothetical protein
MRVPAACFKPALVHNRALVREFVDQLRPRKRVIQYSRGGGD